MYICIYIYNYVHSMCILHVTNTHVIPRLYILYHINLGRTELYQEIVKEKQGGEINGREENKALKRV